MLLLDIFGFDVSGWIQGIGVTGVVGIIVTVLRKKGYILTIKGFSKKAAIVTKEVGEFFSELSDVFEATDKAITEDGHLIENSVKDVIKAGKEARLEFNDVIMTIKPKRK